VEADIEGFLKTVVFDLHTFSRKRGPCPHSAPPNPLCLFLKNNIPICIVISIWRANFLTPPKPLLVQSNPELLNVETILSLQSPVMSLSNDA
jgi:hypothetical protein